MQERWRRERVGRWEFEVKGKASRAKFVHSSSSESPCGSWWSSAKRNFFEAS